MLPTDPYVRVNTTGASLKLCIPPLNGRCRLDPMKKTVKTIKKYLWGILNAIVLEVNNGPVESINSGIKSVKVRARGYRNIQQFATEMYFYLGGLDMYPEGYRNQLTHS